MEVVNFIKQKFKNLSNIQKISIFVCLLVFTLIMSFTVPSLARYKNRNPLDLTTVWDGSVASSYRSGDGTKDNPYIISNGAELAFFSSMAKEDKTGYKDKYFKLDSNIVLNNGLFNYESTVKYTLNTTEFYIKEYTNEFYDNENYEGVKIGTINTLNPISNFNGHFDGNGYIIYGLYTYSDKDETSLFTNLKGTVENLYVKNSMIYGGQVTGGIASTTNGATLKNVMNEGFVIGLDEGNENLITNDMADIERTIESTSNELITTITNYPVINGEVVSTSITGKLEKTGDGNLLINNTLVEVDENGLFTIELGSTVLTYITLSYTNATNTTYKLTNLKYNINYKQLVSGGIVGISYNTNYENVINKAQVYGNINSGGLIGLLNGKSNINQSYNNGKIVAFENAGGLISSVNYNANDINITKAYNKGEITATNNGGIISNIKENTGKITIQNTLSIGNGYAINILTNSNVEITNSYRTDGYSNKTGSTNGIFELSTNLYNKEYQLNTLLYNKFIDNTDVKENTSNVWVYEENSLPILFIDDLNNPIATLFVNTHSWNDLGYELSRINYNEQITFSIEPVSDLRPISETYYYISKSEIPLTRTQIESIESPESLNEMRWTPYTDIVQITEEGFYVIYVKVVDTNGEVTYINSELLVLDLSNPTASLNYNTYSWDTYKDTLDYVYIDKEILLSLNYNDTLSGIKDASYYISSGVLSIDELNGITNWIKYEETIPINNIGSYIVYAKVVDNVGKVTYVNTDVITYGGYSLNTIYAGRNLLDNNRNITYKSEAIFNFTYADDNPYKEGYTHNIISNKSLPIGTKIILKDNINNKKYVYMIDSEMEVIPFTLFKEIGIDKDVYYKEEITDGVNEDYSVVLDLSNTNIETDILDLRIHLAIYDADSIKVRTTLESTLKGINIYVNSSKTYISTSYQGNPIAYDSSSETTIPLTAGINYPLIYSNKIYDTVIEDKILGLAIKMVDSEGNIIDKKYLKNIKYTISDVQYGIDDDGIARINLNNGINPFNSNLVISTTRDNSELESGNYYFKIYSYVSYDGKYTNEYSTDVVTIPVTNNTSKVTYSFDVILNNTNRVISKEEETTPIHFEMLQKGPFYNPNIRVSLYKKTELTAYNQSYTLVDLKEYVTNELESVTDDIYYASKYPYFYTGYKNSYNLLDLELINSKFENTGYMFVFELYEGNTKIGTKELKFIVK